MAAAIVSLLLTTFVVVMTVPTYSALPSNTASETHDEKLPVFDPEKLVEGSSVDRPPPDAVVHSEKLMGGFRVLGSEHLEAAYRRKPAEDGREVIGDPHDVVAADPAVAPLPGHNGERSEGRRMWGVRYPFLRARGPIREWSRDKTTGTSHPSDNPVLDFLSPPNAPHTPDQGRFVATRQRPHSASNAEEPDRASAALIHGADFRPVHPSAKQSDARSGGGDNSDEAGKLTLSEALPQVRLQYLNLLPRIDGMALPKGEVDNSAPREESGLIPTGEEKEFLKDGGEEKPKAHLPDSSRLLLEERPDHEAVIGERPDARNSLLSKLGRKDLEGEEGYHSDPRERPQPLPADHGYPPYDPQFVPEAGNIGKNSPETYPGYARRMYAKYYDQNPNNFPGYQNHPKPSHYVDEGKGYPGYSEEKYPKPSHYDDKTEKTPDYPQEAYPKISHDGDYGRLYSGYPRDRSSVPNHYKGHERGYPGDSEQEYPKSSHYNDKAEKTPDYPQDAYPKMSHDSDYGRRYSGYPRDTYPTPNHYKDYERNHPGYSEQGQPRSNYYVDGATSYPGGSPNTQLIPSGYLEKMYPRYYRQNSPKSDYRNAEQTYPTPRHFKDKEKSYSVQEQPRSNYYYIDGAKSHAGRSQNTQVIPGGYLDKMYPKYYQQNHPKSGYRNTEQTYPTPSHFTDKEKGYPGYSQPTHPNPSLYPGNAEGYPGYTPKSYPRQSLYTDGAKSYPAYAERPYPKSTHHVDYAKNYPAYFYQTSNPKTSRNNAEKDPGYFEPDYLTPKVVPKPSHYLTRSKLYYQENYPKPVPYTAEANVYPEYSRPAERKGDLPKDSYRGGYPAGYAAQTGPEPNGAYGDKNERAFFLPVTQNYAAVIKALSKRGDEAGRSATRQPPDSYDSPNVYDRAHDSSAHYVPTSAHGSPGGEYGSRSRYDLPNNGYDSPGGDYGSSPSSSYFYHPSGYGSPSDNGSLAAIHGGARGGYGSVGNHGSGSGSPHRHGSIVTRSVPREDPRVPSSHDYGSPALSYLPASGGLPDYNSNARDVSNNYGSADGRGFANKYGPSSMPYSSAYTGVASNNGSPYNYGYHTDSHGSPSDYGSANTHGLTKSYGSPGMTYGAAGYGATAGYGDSLPKHGYNANGHSSSNNYGSADNTYSIANGYGSPVMNYGAENRGVATATSPYRYSYNSNSRDSSNIYASDNALGFGNSYGGSPDTTHGASDHRANSNHGSRYKYDYSSNAFGSPNAYGSSGNAHGLANSYSSPETTYGSNYRGPAADARYGPTNYVPHFANEYGSANTHGYGSGNTHDFASAHGSTNTHGFANTYGSTNTHGYGTANTHGYGSANIHGYDSADTNDYGSANTHGYDTANTRGYGSANTHGYDTANTHGYGSANTHGYDTADTHGYGSAITHGYDSANTHGYGSANTHGYGTANTHGYDSANTHGYGTANTHGYDSANTHGYDSANTHGSGSANTHGFTDSYGSGRYGNPYGQNPGHRQPDLTNAYDLGHGTNSYRQPHNEHPVYSPDFSSDYGPAFNNYGTLSTVPVLPTTSTTTTTTNNAANDNNNNHHNNNDDKNANGNFVVDYGSSDYKPGDSRERPNHYGTPHDYGAHGNDGPSNYHYNDGRPHNSYDNYHGPRHDDFGSPNYYGPQAGYGSGSNSRHDPRETHGSRNEYSTHNAYDSPYDHAPNPQSNHYISLANGYVSPGNRDSGNSHNPLIYYHAPSTNGYLSPGNQNSPNGNHPPKNYPGPQANRFENFDRNSNSYGPPGAGSRSRGRVSPPGSVRYVYPTYYRPAEAAAAAGNGYDVHPGDRRPFPMDDHRGQDPDSRLQSSHPKRGHEVAHGKDKDLGEALKTLRAEDSRGPLVDPVLTLQEMQMMQRRRFLQPPPHLHFPSRPGNVNSTLIPLPVNPDLRTNRLPPH